MTISLVGTATGTTTCTVPTHAVGDLIVIFAFRGTSATAPGTGSTYTSILTKSGTGCSARLAFKIATATNDSSGTWSNSTQLTCHVYRSSTYATGGSVFPGGSASNSSTSNTVNYPALTMTHGDNTSWVAGFAGVNNTTMTVNTAPSGMQNESSVVGAASSVAGQDTEGTVSSWSSTNATTTGTAGDSVSATLEITENLAGTASISNIIQHVSYAYNAPIAVTETSASYVFTLPNAVGSSNALVMAVAYPSGTAPNSITDNESNSWSTTAKVTADPGAGNQALKVYVLASATAGTQKITLGFASAVQPVKVWITELYNITATVNGTAEATAVNSLGLVSPGSMTPTNNNANGGNLVLSYMCNTNATGTTNPFRINAATGYTLNDADIGWNTGAGMPNASQFYLQATSAATVASFNMANGGTSDTYNVAALALSVGTQGTAKPSGIHIDRICYFSSNSNVSPQTFQIPATGNCGLITTFCSTTANPTISSATDSDSNSWATESTSAGNPTFLLGSNLTQNPGRTLAITFGQTAQNLQLLYYDISGAATSPLDTKAGNTANLNGLTTIASMPSITPGAANELVVAFMQIGIGPSTAVTAPSGATFDLPTYTGETDSSTTTWGNAAGHLYNTTTSAESWTWTITNEASNSGTATAIALKAAPTSTTWTGTSTWAGVGTIVEANERQIDVASATLGGVGTLVEGNESQIDVASATLGGVGTLTPTVTWNAAATFPGVGTLSDSETGVARPGVATLSGVGTLVEANETSKQSAQATLGGVGTLSDSETGVTRPGAATLGGVGTLSDSETGVTRPGTATLGGVGTLVEGGEISTQSAQATLGGVGLFSPASSGATTWTGTATLPGITNLVEANESQIDVASATLSGIGTLAESGESQVAVAGATLGGLGTFSAVAVGGVSGVAVLGGAADEEIEPQTKRRRKWLADHDLELPKVRIVRESKPAVTPPEEREAPQANTKPEAPPLNPKMRAAPVITLPPSLLSSPAVGLIRAIKGRDNPPDAVSVAPLPPSPPPTFSQRISEIAALSAAQRNFTERLSAIAAERTAQRQRDRDEDDVAAVLGMM